jgi:hypothetical protein
MSRDPTAKAPKNLLRKAEMFLFQARHSGSNAEKAGLGADVPDDRIRVEDRALMEELARLDEALGDFDDLGGLRRDGSFDTRVSEDKMFMTMTLHAPLAGGDPVTAKQVVDYLQHQGVRRGVDLPRIREATDGVTSGGTIEDVVIVRGRHAQPGKAERFEYYARQSLREEPEKVDPERLSQTTGVPCLCAEGDLIARHVSPEPGKDGYNALGETLPAPRSTTSELRIGRHVSRQGDDFHSQVTGVVRLENGQLNVHRVLVLHEDVTPKACPIDFEGDIHIAGAVRSGAEVRATGNILVDGPVESARIESTEGSITLDHGVSGRDQGFIIARHNVSTRFAERATIEAGRNITIEMGTMHARLSSGGRIIAVKGRGQVLGGTTMAGQLIHARQLGTPAGISTELIVGLPRLWMRAVGIIAVRLAELSKQADDAAQLADRIRHLVASPLDLPKPLLGAYTRLRRLQLVSRFRIDALTERRQEILARCPSRNQGVVQADQRIFEGVTIRIGPSHHTTDTEHKAARFSYDRKTGQIVHRGAR